jgi:hypothetical protein
MHLVGYLYEDYHDARSLEHNRKAHMSFFSNFLFPPAHFINHEHSDPNNTSTYSGPRHIATDLNLII